jgi:hypothetical protein
MANIKIAMSQQLETLHNYLPGLAATEMQAGKGVCTNGAE